MASRNLTKKFLEIRNAAKANRSIGKHFDETDGDKGLLKQSGSDSSNWNAVKNSLPPAWVDKIEEVEEDISKIQLKMGEVDALHRKRLKVNFETDEAQQEFEIESKTREVTEVFHHAESLLKKFGKQSEDPNLTPAERTVRKNMQMAMAKKLQSLSLAFRSQQKKYMETLNTQKVGSGAQAFDFLNEEKKAGPGEFVDRGFTQDQMQLLEDTEMMIDMRNEEIVKIAKSIEELAQIFRELAVLVIDQGTILDRIDYNMENAVAHAKEGVQQLEKAEEHQKNSLSIKCIILLVILIIIMVGILIWKHQGK